MKKLLFAMTAILAGVGVASAGCPVCTVAVGAALEGARLFGVDDIIVAIWAGGLTFSLIGWTANYMRKRGVKGRFWYALNFVAYYVLLSLVYFVPTSLPYVVYKANCIWGIDQFLLGTIIGSVVFWTMESWYENIKKNNGGHAKYPFQKVVMPFTGLLVTTVIVWAVLHWLPKMGIVIC